MHRTRGHSDTYSFRCLANDRIAKNTCLPVSVKESDMKSVIVDELKGKAGLIEDQYGYLLNHSDSVSSKISTPKAEITTLKQRIEKNRMYLKSLYESLTQKIITTQEYFEMKADYEAKISSALLEISDIDSKQKKFESQKKKFGNMADSVQKIRKSKDLNPMVVETLIDKILLYTDKRIEVKYRFEGENNAGSEGYMNEEQV